MCRLFLDGVSKPIEKTQNDAFKKMDHFFVGPPTKNLLSVDFSLFTTIVFVQHGVF